MEPTLDDVRSELADIHDRLLALPAEDFAARATLKDRQNELRQLSYELLEEAASHDADLLRAAYQRMSDLRDQLLALHLSHTSQSAGDAGIEDSFTSAVNRAIDQGRGVDEVEARLEEILRQLRTTR